MKTEAIIPYTEGAPSAAAEPSPSTKGMKSALVVPLRLIDALHKDASKVAADIYDVSSTKTCAKTRSIAGELPGSLKNEMSDADISSAFNKL